MLPARSLDAHIAMTPGVSGGEPCVAGRRIKVRDVAIWHERLGLSADQISSEHDLSLSEIHAALAYYFDHREEIDREIRTAELFAETMRASNRSKLSEKLRVR